jgi:hypothetical protein
MAQEFLSRSMSLMAELLQRLDTFFSLLEGDEGVFV